MTQKEPESPSTIPLPSSKKVYQRGKFEGETTVPACVITAHQGSIKLERAEEINGELIKNPSNKKDSVYYGWPPSVIEINSNIFPKWYQRLLAKKWLRLRGYFKLAHEPMTRNPFTGEILDPIKKRETLIERRVIDTEGFFLDTEGNRFDYQGCWIKVDVSDIDFIKNEFHAVDQSKAQERGAKAMQRTGMTIDDMWKWILLAAFLCIFGIVFVMSGGI